MKNRRSAFSATRLTRTTFLIKEVDDVYSEHPHIYAKIVSSANAILIIDTGCGGASHDPKVEITSLREFIETVPVADNNDKPLNAGGRMRYVITTTHCHYDHILGVEQFSDSTILASSYSPEFLFDIPDHSLCNFLMIRCPTYVPTLVSHGHTVRSHDDTSGSLGVVILHTPGHTPDELALYDADEKMLYVGDSLYENEPIIFPNEGSIEDWFISLDSLISLVRSEESSGKQVLLNAGHVTVLRPAEEVLQSAKYFMEDVVSGREPIRKRMSKRGEETVEYRQSDGRFSLICPERLVLDARSS